VNRFVDFVCTTPWIGSDARLVMSFNVHPPALQMFMGVSIVWSSYNVNRFTDLFSLVIPVIVI
jgi:hypothetical protein